jgi:hypothetical protein
LGLLLASFLFPVATTVWSHRRLRRVSRTIEREKSLSKIDNLVSKMNEVNKSILATGVRSRYAAACLIEMGKHFKIVSECTEQFVKESRN